MFRPIDTPVVEPHNELAAARETTVSKYSEVQVPLNHDFNETFYRERFDGKTFVKGDFNNFVTNLCKLQSHYFFDFPLYFHLFYTDGRATD